ncbi:hypothetical protein WDU94_001189 [Cyamophila willieti]
MEKNHSLNEIKQFLQNLQYNSQDNPTKEKFLELIAAYIHTIMNDDSSNLLFHLALKYLFPTCLSHFQIDEWEQTVLKDSLTTVSLYLTKLISQLDVEINTLIQENNPSDMLSMSIHDLIQDCYKVLGPINSLLESSLCQYHLIGSKVPSILLSIPDIMLLVCNHCAQNKVKYESHCDDTVINMMKKLYTNNKLIQTTYLTLLEDKLDFTNSQETEVLEESLEKLSKLASVLLQLDIVSAYAAFKTYCNLAMRYVGNLKTTLHITPAVHAMSTQVTRYIEEFREYSTPQADPLQAKKTKLFRVFIKLIIDLVDKYSGYLRDTHTTLVSLLTTLYDFTLDSQRGDIGTLVEGAANNLVSSCCRDSYFTNELLRSTNTSTRGFINLCSMVMKRKLEFPPDSAMGLDDSDDESKLVLVQAVLQAVPNMQVKQASDMLGSDQYKLTVSTLSVLCLTLTPAGYSQLESLLFETVLSSNLSSIFACDIWCILLNSSTKSLFEATCMFLVQYVNSWDPAGYNFSYVMLTMLLKRCLTSIKQTTVKKMFANGTLCYNKYPVLLSLIPNHLSTSHTPVPSSIPNDSSSTLQLLQYQLIQSNLNPGVFMETLHNMDWDDPRSAVCIDILCASLQASLVAFDQQALTELFQSLADILSNSDSPFTWLSILEILSSLPTPDTPPDRHTIDVLFSTILSRVNSNPDDYLNKAITTFGAVMAKMDKKAFLRVLKKLDCKDLVSKYVSQFSQTGVYDTLNQLGTVFQMQCHCIDTNDNDIQVKHSPDENDMLDDNKPNNEIKEIHSQSSDSEMKPAGMLSQNSSSRTSFEFEDDKENSADQNKMRPLEKHNMADLSESTKRDGVKVSIDDVPKRTNNEDPSDNASSTIQTKNLATSKDMNNRTLENTNDIDCGNQTKRIKLEDNVEVNVEIEKRLNELEVYLREKKHVMNSNNRARLNELVRNIQ